MKRLEEFTKQDWQVCHWLGTKETFHHLATSKEKTQSQHIVKPIHWYIACRLVIEGGFQPNEIKPRPPFEVVKKGTSYLLHFDSNKASGKEATVLGGLKTNDVDVVVEKPGIGPVIAISCKTTGKAFRNLTNRMEEAVGEVHKLAHDLRCTCDRILLNTSGAPRWERPCARCQRRCTPSRRKSGGRNRPLP